MRPRAILVLVQERHPPGSYSREASLVISIIRWCTDPNNSINGLDNREQMYVYGLLAP